MIAVHQRRPLRSLFGWSGSAVCWAVFFQLVMITALPGQIPKLILPTENDKLFQGNPEEFYMYVDRTFRGERSTPWEGGQYGFVRTPRETAAGVVYSRFHAGIDIRPVRRDSQGIPLDPVVAIADGTVVHANRNPGRSNYGNYVVIRHDWDGSPYFSLYAHLANVEVQPGQRIRQGESLGRLGYTGVGLDRRRAHLHLELNLMASENYNDWHRHYIPNSPNHHGIHNGLNLIPLDITRLYMAQRENPGLTMPQFLAGEEMFFKVRLPHSPNLHLLRNYPWLAGPHARSRPASWDISFNNAGVPLRMTPSDTAVDRPTLLEAAPSRHSYTLVSRGYLQGSAGTVSISDRGQRFLHLLSFPR